MKRKVVKTGASLAVTIPRDVIEQFDLKAGDEVDVSVHPRTGAMVVRPGVAYVDGGKVTARVKRLTATLIKRRARLYKALAR
jgi:antitoxin component of MazEF toxin-antitoxin module